jgi:hypothetical protein
MLLFNCSNLAKESPMFVRQFFIAGDGESRTLNVDLTSSPVGMEFRNDKTPAYAFLRSASGSNCEVSLSIEGRILTFEFTEPPAKGERVDVVVELYYS